MWNYEKRLQYPIKITKSDPQMASVIISQFGGLYSSTHVRGKSRIINSVMRAEL